MSDDLAPAPRPDDVPSVRASDAERRHTAEVLEQAFAAGRLDITEFEERTSAAWAARYDVELARLVADLPSTTAGPGAVPAPGYTPGVPSRVSGGDGPSATFAVMSGAERRGDWTVPASHTAFALMGGVELDLRGAALASAHTEIRVLAVMGAVDVVVPADVRVVVEGFGLMGGFAQEDDKGAPVPPAPGGAPVVRVSGFALMGSVSVRRVAVDDGSGRIGGTGSRPALY